LCAPIIGKQQPSAMTIGDRTLGSDGNKSGGRRGKTAAVPVVVPVHAKQVRRVCPIGIDEAKRGNARFGDSRRGG
jgi:hypothetical protein